MSILQLSEDILVCYLSDYLDPLMAHHLGYTCKRYQHVFHKNDRIWQYHYQRTFITWRHEKELIQYLMNQFGSMHGVYWARQRLEKQWLVGPTSWPHVIWHCPGEVGRAIGMNVDMSAIQIDASCIALLKRPSTITNDILYTPTTLLDLPTNLPTLINEKAKQIKQLTQPVHQEEKDDSKEEKEIASIVKDWRIQSIMLNQSRLLVFVVCKQNPPAIVLWKLDDSSIERILFGGPFKYIRFTNTHIMGLRGRKVEMVVYPFKEPNQQRIIRENISLVGVHPWNEDLYISYHIDTLTQHTPTDLSIGDWMNWKLWDIHQIKDIYPINTIPSYGPYSIPILSGQILLRGYMISSVHGAQLTGENDMIILWGTGRENESRHYIGWIIYGKMNQSIEPIHQWIFEHSPYQVISMSEYHLLIACIRDECIILSTLDFNQKQVIQLEPNSTFKHLLGPYFTEINQQKGICSLIDVRQACKLWTFTFPTHQICKQLQSPSTTQQQQQQQQNRPKPIRYYVNAMQCIMVNLPQHSNKVLGIYPPI
jgi:hypothetical protein